MLVTRPEEHAEELAARLRALGHEPVACPLVRLEAIGEGAVAVDGYDWVVVTSKTGAEHLLRRARGRLPRVAAIGPGTAATLRAHGVEPALVPEESTQEGLVAAFPRPAGRVLFAGAEGARRVLVDALAADFVALYRTVPAAPDGGLPPGDAVVAASPSAARVLAPAWAALPPGERPLVVSIGPQTSAAAREAGLPVDVEARRFDLEGLLEAVQRAAQVAADRPARPESGGGSRGSGGSPGSGAIEEGGATQGASASPPPAAPAAQGAAAGRAGASDPGAPGDPCVFTAKRRP